MAKPLDHFEEHRTGTVKAARLFSNIVSPPVMFAILGLAFALYERPFLNGLLWAAVYGFFVSLLPILIVLGALMEIGMLELAIVLGLLTGFGGTAIVVKSQALTIKVRPYIEAARIAGGGHWHIIFKHMMPNLMPIALLYMMFIVNGAIAYEAVLSFFGLTTIEMSWGLMINTTQFFGYLLRFDTWWLLFPASIAISTLCAAFYLAGRALDEVVNPRLRER